MTKSQDSATAPSSKSARPKYLVKVAKSLLSTSDAQDRFVDSVLKGDASSQALAWTKTRPDPLPFTLLPKILMQPDFVDRLTPDQRPGRNPMHDEGFYYCLDTASVQMVLPLVVLSQDPEVKKSIRSIIDVCASPGGKSVLASRLFEPEELVSNEVIGKRRGTLIANLRRCSVAAKTLGDDPSVLARSLPEHFDLVIVDAPCSGQSLIAKGETAVGAFHPVNIGKCMVRQRRVVAHSAALVRPGGWLLYSTCTYSVEENEEVVDWFLKKFPDFLAFDVSELKDHRSTHSENPCYRFWPKAGESAGGFSALLKRKATDGNQE